MGRLAEVLLADGRVQGMAALVDDTGRAFDLGVQLYS